MRRISLATMVVGISIIFALSGCGGGGGGTSTPDNPYEPPLNPNDWVITGKVVSSNGGAGVPNVTVSFGTPTRTATTDANGDFAINLGLITDVLSLFPTSPHIFKVDTTLAGANYPAYLPVQYWGNTYEQSAISLDDSSATLAVLTMQSKQLGTIVATYYDPSLPPPPPSY